MFKITCRCSNNYLPQVCTSTNQATNKCRHKCVPNVNIHEVDLHKIYSKMTVKSGSQLNSRKVQFSQNEVGTRKLTAKTGAHRLSRVKAFLLPAAMNRKSYAKWMAQYLEKSMEEVLGICLQYFLFLKQNWQPHIQFQEPQTDDDYSDWNIIII